MSTPAIRIFLASPSDLVSEREVWRGCVNLFNEGATYGIPSIELLEWPQVRGTARRPQQAINDLVLQSHYMAVIFKQKWGSVPGSEWGYTSGTEEELFTGLQALGREDLPMRDVWMGFADWPTREPAVIDLRDQIIEKHSLLFDTWSNLETLRIQVEQLLKSWSGHPPTKEVRHVDLMPSSGRDILNAAAAAHKGELLIDLGQTEQGLRELEKAGRLGGPLEKTQLARAQRHAGLLEEAQETLEIAMREVTESNFPNGCDLARVVAEMARTLQSKGEDRSAVGRLETALSRLVSSDDETRRSRARILDDIGLASHRLGDIKKAEMCFKEAFNIRRALDDPRVLAQSLINLARIDIAKGDLVGARGKANKAQEYLYAASSPSLSANAFVLLAQLDLREGEFLRGVESAKRAIQLNEQTENRKGQAISQMLLAQCLKASGDVSAARKAAQTCLDLNKSLEYTLGQERANKLLDSLDN